MRTERAEALIRQALTEGRVRPFIRSKVVRHIEAPMTQMLLGEPQVKQMAAALVRHGFTHDSSMALNTKIAHHKFKRGHRLITVTRFKEPEGNRVVWSSAGLTGHGQDGRGEHYTTLTTHLRAITPRRVHEEQSRFKIEPAPNSGIPPDFADYRNRAWLSPEGKVHALKQGTPEEPWRGDTHGGWAVDNKHVHGESGDLWTMFDNMQANGWVRKTAKDFYDIGPYDEDSIATVHKHFTTHHPELDSVRVYTRENGGTLHRLYKGGVNEQIVHLPPSKFITEPSLDDVPGDWAEMHNRAWISPEGEVHHLKQHPTTPWMSQTHFDWAKSNQELHGFKSSDPFTIPSKLLQNGWVRTTTKNYYHVHEPTEAALETIHKHFTTHHPKLRKVNVHANDGTMLTLFKKLRDPAAGKAHQLTQEAAGDGRERPDRGGDFEDSVNRAWISPEGELHPLGPDDENTSYPFPTATHYRKAAKILGKENATAKEQSDAFDELMAKGWVRKVSRRSYQAQDTQSGAKIVHQHIVKHHPDVNAAVVAGYRGYGAGVKCTFVSRDGEMYESEHSWKDEFGELGDFAEPKHRAWISPEGKMHPLGRDGQETHGGWITRVRGPNAFTEYNDMTKAGWVRKVNPRRYSGGKHAVKNALAHARQYHPEVGRILFTVADQSPYREYVIDTKTGKGVTRGLKKPMSEGEVGIAYKVDTRPRPRISSDFEDAENRAWISPKGEVHKLEKSRPGDPWDHFPTKTHYTKASEILGNGLDSGATQQYRDFHDLLGDGWVRKVSRTTYNANDPHRAAALVHQHLVKHHPDVEAAIIHGPKNEYTFVSKDGEVYA